MTFHIRYGLTARAWPQLGLLSALAFMGAAQAQQVPAAPATPSPVPLVSYSSAFDRYPKQGDAPATDWKLANDVVGQKGGWRAYAKEAQDTKNAAKAAAATATTTTQPGGQQ